MSATGLTDGPRCIVLDTARLYRLALEKGDRGSQVQCGRRRGRAVSRNRGSSRPRPEGKVIAKSPEEAAEHFGWLGFFMGIDVPASSAQTQERLGWRPTQPGLISDLDHARYFDA